MLSRQQEDRLAEDGVSDWRAIGAGSFREFDPMAFSDNRAKLDSEIFDGRAFNRAMTLVAVKPLYGSCWSLRLRSQCLSIRRKLCPFLASERTPQILSNAMYLDLGKSFEETENLRRDREEKDFAGKPRYTAVAGKASRTSGNRTRLLRWTSVAGLACSERSPVRACNSRRRSSAADRD